VLGGLSGPTSNGARETFGAASWRGAGFGDGRRVACSGWLEERSREGYAARRSGCDCGGGGGGERVPGGRGSGSRELPRWQEEQEQAGANRNRNTHTHTHPHKNSRGVANCQAPTDIWGEAIKTQMCVSGRASEEEGAGGAVSAVGAAQARARLEPWLGGWLAGWRAGWWAVLADGLAASVVVGGGSAAAQRP
jgi:hypothetical protein